MTFFKKEVVLLSMDFHFFQTNLMKSQQYHFSQLICLKCNIFDLVELKHKVSIPIIDLSSFDCN